MIILKRLLCIFLFLCTLTLYSCNRTKESEESFVRSGIYCVELEGTDIEFTAVLNGEYQEYTFTSPETIAGLKAVSYDGVSFEVDYKGIKQSFFSKAIECATDFSAATELLETTGSVKGEKIQANAEGLKAEGCIYQGQLSSLKFSDTTDTRIYNIKSEATE